MISMIADRSLILDPHFCGTTQITVIFGVTYFDLLTISCVRLPLHCCSIFAARAMILSPSPIVTQTLEPPFI